MEWLQWGMILYGIVFFIFLGFCFIAKSLPSPAPVPPLWQWLVEDEPQRKP